MKNRRSSNRGSSLVEVTVGLVILIGMAVAGLVTIISALRSQQWAVKQTLADATIGVDEALAKRYPFNDIDTSGIWPTYPSVATQQESLGKMYGGTAKMPDGTYVGREVFGTATRTKRLFVDPNSGLTSYQLETYLQFTVFEQPYFKVRKVVRTQ